ncbi:MAG TPA: hypothetical protein VL588_12370 [Bdellovibrionota bacterium]|nr:hypothetical protein [Bdellovibrionota bacterium]
MARVHTLALAALVTASTAHAGGLVLTEAQVQGAYQSCVEKQTEALHFAIFDKEPHHWVLSNWPNGDWIDASEWQNSGEYHNPWIGPATLEMNQSLVATGDTGGREDTLSLDMKFRYHRGELDIEATRYSPFDCHYNDRCSTDTEVEVRKLWLPYYEYETETREEQITDNLGHVTRVKKEFIKGDPQLMVYKTPEKLLFLNDDTGQPIRDKNGSPMAFDVPQYKSCLKDSLQRYSDANQRGQVGLGLAAVASPQQSDAIVSGKGTIGVVGGCTGSTGSTAGR